MTCILGYITECLIGKLPKCLDNTYISATSTCLAGGKLTTGCIKGKITVGCEVVVSYKSWCLSFSAKS